MNEFFTEQFKWFIRGSKTIENLSELQARIIRISGYVPVELQTEIEKRIIEINSKMEIKTDRTDYFR